MRHVIPPSGDDGNSNHQRIEDVPRFLQERPKPTSEKIEAELQRKEASDQSLQCFEDVM